jgi:hypothetical protein
LTKLTHAIREYGVCPIESLDRWTGALHLANKWGFEAIRDAAVKAILPLASSVDKIVLGRRYNLFTWVSPAFVELLERDEDLSMEEAKLLELEDVVMIGKGRLQARRVSGIRSTTDIKTIVAKLLPDETLVYGEVPLDKSGSLDEREHDAATHRSPAPSDVNDFEVDAQEAVEACMRMSSNGSLPSEALLCIDDFIAKGSGHASTAVTAVLDYLWARYDLHWRASITQNPAPVYIGAEGRLLLHLKRRMVSKAFDDIVSNYCINRIAAWKGLFHSSVVDQDDLTLDAWTTSKGLDSLPVALLNMASAARFIRYIIDTNLVADGCLPLNWCAKFWWRLEGVFEVLWAAGAPGLNNRLVTILTLTGQSVFFNMKSLKLFYKCVNAACVQNAWNPDSDAHSAIRDDLISPVRTRAKLRLDEFILDELMYVFRLAS